MPRSVHQLYLTVLTLAAASLPAPGHTQSSAFGADTGRRSMAASAADLFSVAERLAQLGDRVRARQLLDLLSRDPNTEVRTEAKFRQALMLETEGKNPAAAILLRQILDDKPNAGAVRLRLASLLQKMGDAESALRELRRLRTLNLPPQVARFVDRFSGMLQATKPLGFQIEVALAPDSNINRATRSDTLGTVIGDFTLDDAAKARSGIGVALRGIAQARKPLGRDLALIARADGEADLYRHKAFDEVDAELSVGAEYRVDRMRIHADAGLGAQTYGLKLFQRNLRLSASATQPIGASTQLRLDASVRWSDNHFNDLQDGSGWSLGARVERSLSPRLVVGASATTARFEARDNAYSLSSRSIGLSAARDMGRITLSVNADYGWLTTDDRLQLFPAARRDRWGRLALGAVFRQLTIGQFSPVARLVIERNRSNISIYDFSRTRTEFGVSRAF